ncbi:MAG: alginate export family protein [Polyangiaceae bacterium]
MASVRGGTAGTAVAAGAAVAIAMTLAGGRVALAQVAPPAPTTLAVGDWQIAPLAQVRARGEYRYDLLAHDQWMLLERARLGADALDGPVEARVVLQDARALSLGDAAIGPDYTPASTFTGAYEAWAEAHTGIRNTSFVRVGRQPVEWGEGRILGTDDWSAAGRSLDAARARVTTGDGAFELLGAVLVDPAVPNALANYGELFGGRAAWTFDPLLAIEGYFLWRVAHQRPLLDDDGSVEGRTGVGALRVHGNGHGWVYAAEGAYELGHADVPNLERSAFAAAAHVSKQLETIVWQPTLGVSGSYASGGSSGSHFTTFEPILPDAHRWHGLLDLVTWSNEVDVGGSVHASPWQDGDVGVEYRYLRLADPGGAWTGGYLETIGLPDPGNTKGELGHEIDATVRWSPWAPVDFAAGYGLLVVSDGARKLVNGPFPPDNVTLLAHKPSLVHSGYLQVTLAVP